MTLKALTLRIDQNLYEEVKNFAKKENTSLNSFFEKIILEKIKEKEKQVLFNEFSIVGESEEEYDTESYIYAQSEVILNEKP